MKNALVLFGLVFASAAQANWTVHYRSQGRTVIEEFTVAADGWQDKVHEWRFSSDAEAREFLASRGHRFELESLPEKGKELRAEAAGLWTAENKWDLSWERKFSDWVSSEIDAKFFTRYKLATDCADVLYTLRWIFARMNKLEMANRLAGSGDYFTHRSLRSSWAQLPTADKWYEDRRFLAALNYLMDNTFTHSLMDDSYPIVIDRQAVVEGVYHLDLHRDSGHTQIIYRTDRTPGVMLPFIIMQSTVPRKVREVSMGGFWYRTQPLEGKGGLLRMRWPVFSSGGVSLVRGDQMPFFSREQYDPKFLRTPKTSYNHEVYLRLNPNLDFKKVLEEAYISLKMMFSERIQVVEEGFKACPNRSCAPDSQKYDDWSTPSRDARILDLINQIGVIAQSVRAAGPPPFVNEPFFELDGAGTDKYSLAALISAWNGERYSSDPNDIPVRRWGVSAEGMRLWAFEKIPALLKARSQKLSQGQKSNEEDVKLMSIRSQAKSYCNSSPVAQCDRWIQILENEKIALRGETLSLRAALARLAWMSPLPSDSTDMQWGVQEKNFSWLDLSFFKKSEFSPDGLGWFQEKSGAWVLADLSSPKPTALLRGGPVATAGFMTKEKLVYEIRGQSLRLLPMTGAAADVALDFEPTAVRVYGSVLLLSNVATSDYLIGQIRSGQWISISRGKANSGIEPRFDSSVPGVLLGMDRDYTLWDFSEDTPRFWKVALTDRGAVRAVSKDFIVLGAPSPGIFLKKNAQWLPKPELAKAFAFHESGRSGFTLEMDEANTSSQFFEITSGGSVILKQKIVGMPWVRSGSASFFADGNLSKAETYEWLETELRKIAPLADESAVLYGQGPILVTKTHDDQYRLRSGSHVLFQGKGYLKLLMTLAGQPAYFETMDPSTGLFSVRSLRNPSAPLLSQATTHFSLGDDQSVEYGSMTSNGLWLK
jgi:hypothetical protein